MWSSVQTDGNWTEWKKLPTLDTRSHRKWTWNTRYNTKCANIENMVQLDTFWKTTVCPTRWKLQVYDAMIRNKLLYGLETVHLTQTQQKKVNAFQLRGIRKILGLSTTFVNRSNRNEYVLQRANEEIGHTPGTPSKIKSFSELLKDRRMKLLDVFCDLTTVIPWGGLVLSLIQRWATMLGKGGGPRQQWLLYTNRYAWEKIERGTFENIVEQNHK